MAVHFSEKRWNKLRDTYSRWWAGELKRPVSGIAVVDRTPKRPCPPAPKLSQSSCLDYSWSAEELIDRLDWELERLTFLGDSFPFINLDCFGPGVVSCFLGAAADNTTGRVWFEPPEVLPAGELHFEYKPLNPLLLRIKAICRAAVDRWGSSVVVGMPDLGGVLDILQVFRPGEKILLDFYDDPDAVKRLVGEVHQLWHRYYDEFSGILQAGGAGYSDWGGIYSEVPFYTLQCDLSYMIGTDMFREFALDEIEASAQRLGRSIYHLDGTGALKHLDDILLIDCLSGLQWIPGDGKPSCRHWPEVYRKTAGRGKKIQSLGSPLGDLLSILIQTGRPELIQHNGFIVRKSDDNEMSIDGDTVSLPSGILILILKVFYRLFKPLTIVIGAISGLRQ